MSKMPEVIGRRIPDALTDKFDPSRFRVYRALGNDKQFDIGFAGQRVGMIRWIDTGRASYFLGTMAVEGQTIQHVGPDIPDVMLKLIDDLAADLVYVSPKYLND